MVSVTELRSGRAFKDQGTVFIVLEYKHTKMGRGNATIRVKVRDINSGAVVEKSFVSGSKVEEIELSTKSMQYLYADQEKAYFMDPVTFEQVGIDRTLLSGDLQFLKEGDSFKILFWEEEPFSVELPNSMIFEVLSAPPGVKGDSATSGTKPVVLENNLTVQVPLFIKKGDKIKIDTRTGDYISRVS